jgi:hypothetical protein
MVQPVERPKVRPMKLIDLLKPAHGQGTIESLIASGLTILSFSMFLLLGYRGLVYFTARHSINELLFCLSSLKPQADCETEFRHRTQSFLVFKETSLLHVQKNPQEIVVTFDIQAPGTPDMRIQRKLRQPLERNI